MPPLVPASMNSSPCSLSRAARRIESLKFELPPSMMTSPLESAGTSASIVLSTGPPAGTMIHTTRGALSCAQTSARSLAAAAPIPTCAFTASALRSYTTTWCPPCSRRCTMLPPIRPRPIMASCIERSPLRVIVVIPSEARSHEP